MTSGDIALGQKISFYRKRAKLSQLELELEIDAAQGSISRIENGQVNPTKETIRKIIDVLGLNLIEAAELYELSIEDISKIVRLAGKLNSTLDLDKMLVNAANDITRDLNLSGVCILLVEGDVLRARAIDNYPDGYEVLNKIMGGPITRLKISLENHTDNIIVKSVRENVVLSSFDAYDFTVDVLSRPVTNLLIRFANFQSGIVFPLVSDNKNVIGAVMFMKSSRENFNRELPILHAFTDNLVISILNVIKYRDLSTNTNSA